MEFERYKIVSTFEDALLTIPHDGFHPFSGACGDSVHRSDDSRYEHNEWSGWGQHVRTGHFLIRRGPIWLHGRFWDETWEREPEYRRSLREENPDDPLCDKRWVSLCLSPELRVRSGLLAEYLWRYDNWKRWREAANTVIREGVDSPEWLAEEEQRHMEEESFLRGLARRLRLKMR